MNVKSLMKWLPHILVTLFVLIYGFLLIYKVTATPTPFYDWDESIYVQVGKEMVQHHSLVPLWQGKAWLEKPFLPPLLYGVIVSYVPINPEISTRVATVLLSMSMLGLLYMFIIKAQKNNFFALYVTITSALNPLVLHRSQIVNTDVFLLIGWLGYFLFYKKFKTSLFFLFLGVYSKSLLGLYPICLLLVYEVYQLYITKDKVAFMKIAKQMAIQIAILSIWYVVMFIVFGRIFIQVHFSDHLIKRVTKTIEAHYGSRTYYLDIVKIYFDKYLVIIPISVTILTVQFLRKKVTDMQYFLSLALLPWFLFLNLTKTKIEWYLYPAIPGLVLLIEYPVLLLRNIKPVFYMAIIVLIYIFISQNYPLKSLLKTNYSSYGDIYQLATTAKTQCSELNILVDESSRADHDFLQRHDLLLTTSDIYGQFPSIFYYNGKKTTPFYNKEAFITAIKKSSSHACWSFDEHESELPFSSSFIPLHKFGPHYLYKKV